MGGREGGREGVRKEGGRREGGREEGRRGEGEGMREGGMCDIHVHIQCTNKGGRGWRREGVRGEAGQSAYPSGSLLQLPHHVVWERVRRGGGEGGGATGAADLGAGVEGVIDSQLHHSPDGDSHQLLDSKLERGEGREEREGRGGRRWGSVNIKIKRHGILYTPEENPF